MTTPSRNNRSRWFITGCLGIVICSIAVGILIGFIRMGNNRCNTNSAPGCLKIYRVGGNVSGNSLALNADGRYMAIASIGRLMILDTDTGKVVASAPTPYNNESGYTNPVNVAINAEGTQAAAIMSDNSVAILSASDGEVQMIESESPNLGASYHPIFFSADSRYLLFSMYNYEQDTLSIIRYDIEEKVSQHFIEGRLLLALAPGGDTLAVQSRAGIEIWKYAQTPDILDKIPFPDNVGMSAAFSPDGTALAVDFSLPDAGYQEGTLQLIDVHTGEVYYDTQDFATELEFSPDGKFLIASNGCGARPYKVTEDHTLSHFFLSQETLDPMSAFGQGFSGSEYCSSNIVMDVGRNYLYYGDGEKIGRFDMAALVQTDSMLESFVQTAEPDSPTVELPNPTTAPEASTPTQASSPSFADFPFEAEMTQPGELPDDSLVGNIFYFDPNDIFGAGPAPDKLAMQELTGGGQVPGYLLIGLYENTSNAAAAYENIDLQGEAWPPAIYQDLGIGDDISGYDDSLLGLRKLKFNRCHSVIYIQLPFSISRDQVLSYAQKLDARLASSTCGN